jgi:HSP20 family protein
MTKQSLIPVGTERSVTRRETNPFTFLQHEIDRLFDGFSRNFLSLTATTATLPSMDLSETDKVIEITVELPGLEKKDVELNIIDNL